MQIFIEYGVAVEFDLAGKRHGVQILSCADESGSDDAVRSSDKFGLPDGFVVQNIDVGLSVAFGIECHFQQNRAF